MSPCREIGIITFRVIGWQTNIEAEIPPTQTRGFRRDCGSNFTKATVPMQIRNGTIIHVANQRLNRKIKATLAMTKQA